MHNELVPFQNTDWSNVEKGIKQEILSEISEQIESYILNVEEDKYIDFLVNKYTINKISIGSAPLNISEIKTEKRYNPNTYQYFGAQEIHKVTVEYQFDGDFWLLGVMPSYGHFIISGVQKMGVVFNNDCSTVSIDVEFDSFDEVEFNRQLKEAYEKNFNKDNIKNVNSHAEEFNSHLRNYISQIFKEYKSKYLRKANFMAAIKVSANTSMPQTFSVPAVKVHSDKPTVTNNKAYSTEPTLNYDTYTQILQVLRGIGRSFETKPKNYIGKDEEGIRDAFLPVLETHFDSCTATGETFNLSGKTDLLIRHTDGSNLFVGECKFWKGSKHLSEAIYQLFDRYLTWRDTKTALIIFVKQDDITDVIKKINETCKTHEYFVKYDKSQDENSFSYIFHLPGDLNRLIFLEVLVFHFNKK